MEIFHIMFLISICFCLPLTMAVSCWVCFVVRREQVPIIYFTNLFISNLIQFSGMIIFLIVKENHELGYYHDISAGIYYSAVFANLDFKMCIATERCLVITRPQWNWIRQTKGFVLLCVLVWILSIITVLLVSFSYMISLPLFMFFVLLPFFLFVFTLVWTLKTLPAVTSVPIEEKQRIIGTLVLLLVNHCLTFLSLIIFYIVAISQNFPINIPIFPTLVNLSILSHPFMDVILFFLMWKDPIDNQLLSLCCYTAGEVAADKMLQLQCCSDCNSTVLYTALQQM